VTHQCGKSVFFRGLWLLLSVSWRSHFISPAFSLLPSLTVAPHLGVCVHISDMEQVDLRHDYMDEQQKMNGMVVLTFIIF